MERDLWTFRVKPSWWHNDQDVGAKRQCLVTPYSSVFINGTIKQRDTMGQLKVDHIWDFVC